MRLADRRLGLALILSASIHSLVGWIYLRAPRARFQTPQDVTLLYQQAPAPSAGQPGRKARGRKATQSRKQIPLSALTPKISLRFKEPPPPVTELAPEPPSWTDSTAYDGPGLFGFQDVSSGEISFIASLWRMIDQYIEENRFLSEYNHTGKVFLRFEVDEHGVLEERTFQASAIDRVLKVIAARAVRKALKNETGDVRFPGRRMVIQARFTWGSYQACGSLRGYVGNYLSFCHYAENKWKSFSKGEKVATYAGKIYNHGPWAYEEIKAYHREERRRKFQFDPFEEYKRDPDWNL